jgi:hypothetical protein
MEIVAGTITLIVGLVLLLLAWGNLRYERHRRSHGILAEGRIVGSEWQVNSVTAIYQAPEVEFVDQDGRIRRFRQPSGTTAKPAAGGTVQVRYDPDDPDGSPVIDQDTATRLFPVVFGGAGLIAAAVGVLLLVSAAV